MTSSPMIKMKGVSKTFNRTIHAVVDVDLEVAEGEVVVIAAEKTYKPLARIQLGEKCFSVPAVAGGVMFFRTQSRLFSLGGKAAD